MPLTLASTAPLRGEQLVTPFVIVGTGRSGTGYISRVLKGVGIDCGHEANYHPFYPRHQHFMGSGEASWLAVPFLHEFDGVVIHQTRHPLDVATSLQYPEGFLAGAYPDNPYWQFKQRHLPQLAGSWSSIHNAALFMAAWYDIINEHATHTYRVEDLGPDGVVVLAGLLGKTIDRGTAAAALGDVSTSENSHRPADAGRLTYEDVPTLRRYAEEYGYAD